MIINPKTILNYIKPIDFDQIQPNSIDLTVKSVSIICGSGSLLKKSKILPITKDLTPKSGIFELQSQSAFSVEFDQFIEIPPNVVGFIVCRSTLNRLGAFFTSGLYDSGFNNYVGAVLRTSVPIQIEIGARIATMYFEQAVAAHQYNGQYQGSKA